MLRRIVPLGMLAMASYAHADWTLARASTAVTIIHAASLYQARAGQRLGRDDIVETPASGDAQIQDEGGNTVALGPDTHVLLKRDAHIVVLRGWIKLLHACAWANCATPVVTTARTQFTPANRSTLVIAAAPAGYGGADAVFCESGSVQVLALGTSRGKPARVQLDARQFALRAKANEVIALAASPNPAFVAAMPVTFRDALRTLPPPANLRNLPSRGLRPVTYGDIADWLGSALAVRTDPATRFTERFRPRLADQSFRRAIRQHVDALPEWRPLVSAQPQPNPRVPAVKPLSAYPSILVRP
ncbi:FecR family protein [Paraburkholderia caffeinilytica]|uniref:hypothetical protein n=1 Tax=Paraburkholderia caffeinilytica TaxID=1761016 RepID=UPI0038BA5F7B